MTTVTSTHVIHPQLDFASGDTDQMLPALRLLFQRPGCYIDWTVDENGFHLCRLGDGPRLIPDATWEQQGRRRENLPLIVREVVIWLKRLIPREEERFCDSETPDLPFLRDGQGVPGYRITTAYSDDGQYFMATITPARV